MRLGSRLVAGLVLTVSLGVVEPATHNVAPTSAQIDARLELVSQTIFVGPEPVLFDLRVPSNTQGRQLEIRVHAPTTDPDELRRDFDEPPTEQILSQFTVTNLDELRVGAGDIISIALPDDEIGLLLRKTPGALPVVIDLVDETGILDTVITAVLVDDGSRGNPISLGFLADARVPLAHQVNQSINIDPATAPQGLTELVETTPGPALIRFSPETLTALVNPNVEGGVTALDSITELLADQDLYTTPWVELDEEAWRLANESGRVLEQYGRGNQVIEDLLGRSSTTIVHFDTDTTPATIGLLRSTGATAAIVSEDQLNELDIERANRRPIQVLDDNGVAMPVLAVSSSFAAKLDRSDVELAANQLFVELVLASKQASSPRGILVDLQTVNRPTLDRLLLRMDDFVDLDVRPVGELLDLPPARDATGGVLRVDLRTEPAGDVGGLASDLRLTESVLDSYAEMVAPADAPIAPLRTLLDVALSSDLDEAGQRRYTDTVFRATEDGTTGFEVLEGSRITLATRQADLAVLIQNRQPLAINVVVRLSSEKLRFPNGEDLDLALEPGLTELIIPVETVSSGDARIVVSISSPDGRLDLASGPINVRSTAVSGIGLIISLIALLVLAAWWARTIVRVRRNRQSASVNASPDQEGTSE